MTATNTVEASFDRGEAGFDAGLELEIGEDIGPVVLDAFANEFADIIGIDARRNAFANDLESFQERRRKRCGVDRSSKTLWQIALGVHDLRTDEARAQHRYADPSRSEFETQALG